MKIGVRVGLGIEFCGILIAILCVLAQKQIPDIVQQLVWLGFAVTMLVAMWGKKKNIRMKER